MRLLKEIKRLWPPGSGVSASTSLCVELFRLCHQRGALIFTDSPTCKIWP